MIVDITGSLGPSTGCLEEGIVFETETPIAFPGEPIAVRAVSFIVPGFTGPGVLGRLDHGIRHDLACAKPVPEPLELADDDEG